MVQAGMLAIAGLLFHQGIYHFGPSLKESVTGDSTPAIRVPIDVIIVKPVNVMPGAFYPWPPQQVEEQMAKVAELWGRYGIGIDYSIRSLVNEDWKFVDGTLDGSGEVEEMIGQLYHERPVLAFVPKGDEAWIGNTERGSRGAVIQGGASWVVPAHELGHVFGLSHGTAWHLSLSDDNLMRDGGPRSGLVKKVWLYDYHRYWAYIEILRRGWDE